MSTAKLVAQILNLGTRSDNTWFLSWRDFGFMHVNICIVTEKPLHPDIKIIIERVIRDRAFGNVHLTFARRKGS